MARVSDVINWASKTLEASGVSESRREAASLLGIALQRNRTFLIANPEYVLTEDEEVRFESFLERRSRREPFQHIAGKTEFWGKEFVVNPDVLIPRPETEMIVEEAIGLLVGKRDPQFCEVGIGSGCIAVSILAEIETAEASGFDISKKALAVTKKNAAELGVSDRLSLCVSDIFEKAGDRRFDIIVSNPPYIPESSISDLQVEVRDFDPIIALTDGKDGLSIIRRLIEDSPNYLKPNGFLLVEIGINQAANVKEMFDMNLWETIEILPDLQGIPRMVKAQLAGS